MSKIDLSTGTEKFLEFMPDISNYVSSFKSINKRWTGIITTGMIEVGRMPENVSRLFGPLIKEMSSTTTKYSKIQEQLVNVIIQEMVKKVVSELSDSAKFTINILKRNLFERTADVGYLATDSEIVEYLKFCCTNSDRYQLEDQKAKMHDRLKSYQYEYTVYNEIILLDSTGEVKANLDLDNKIENSSDPLLLSTQKIDLNNNIAEDKFIETYRESDLMPGKGNVLIYSQKIQDPDTHQSLGTLCLCFDFEDEMRGIFDDLRQGNNHMVVGILNANGYVMSSNNTNVLSPQTKIAIDLNSEINIITIGGGRYIYKIVETDGYQGFYGLTWYGIAMISADSAFHEENHNGSVNNSVLQDLQNFSEELSQIRLQSSELLDDMTIDSINGQINAAKSNEASFVEILRFIEQIGTEIDSLFNVAIKNLQKTVVTSLYNDIQFRAFQGNNIADRNLYERANDVCWWALTPLFRNLLTKHTQTDLTQSDLDSLTENLQYINNLYTPYLRLVLADTAGKVVAVSNPPSDLDEKFEKANLPKGQEFVGMQLDSKLIRDALSLHSPKDYTVSNFEPSFLYGGRYTYIYSTAVRDISNDMRTVGVIQIVFDAEPQFKAMLSDVLPKDENHEIKSGCFSLFVDRNKRIVSSTNPEYKIGSSINLDDSLFSYDKGKRISTVVKMNSKNYSLGLQVSQGYREYKKMDGYDNDIICLVFVEI